MTDRHNAYIVVLEGPIREDDAKPIRDAIAMIKGVLSVEPVVSTFDHHIAEDRAYSRIQRELRDVAFANRKTQ